MAHPVTMLSARDFARRHTRTLSSVINEALDRFLAEELAKLPRTGFPYEPLFDSGRPHSGSQRVDEIFGRLVEEDLRRQHEDFADELKRRNRDSNSAATG